MLATMRVNVEHMHARAKGGFINATDAADYLAAHGVPFREAHSIIGNMVKYAEDKGVGLEDLSLAEIRQFSDVFQADIFEYIAIDKCVAARNIPGGPAIPAVEAAIESGKAWLNNLSELSEQGTQK
jgi:argininosuccinate lyase